MTSGSTSGGGERQRHDHPGPVLARRAVHDRRAVRGRDVPQRAGHLVGAFFQVAEVMSGRDVVRVPGAVLFELRDEERLGDRLGGVSQFLQDRAVHVPHGGHGVERRRAFDLEFPGGAQVHDRGDADLLDQFGDVRRRQFLQVLRAQQPAGHGAAAVHRGQPAEVPDVDGTLKIDPSHVPIVPFQAPCPREPPVNSPRRGPGPAPPGGDFAHSAPLCARRDHL